MDLYDQVLLLEDDPDDDDAGPGAPLLSSDINIETTEISKGIPDGHTAFDAYRSENPAGAARKLLEAFATTSLEWTEQYRRVVSFLPLQPFICCSANLRSPRLSSFRLPRSLIRN